MAGGFGRDRGGIFGLCDLVEGHAEAVEYDLIRHGLRLRDLGSKRLTWRDLFVILTQQRMKDSAMAFAVAPNDAPWDDISAHLLAEIVDVQHMLLWAKTKDGQKGRHRPQPVPRPGRRPERFGSKPLPLDEMKAWLGW